MSRPLCRAALLAAVALSVIASTPRTGRGVDVVGVWGGDELEGFRAMVSPWEERTGHTVSFAGTRDLSAVLTARVEGGRPPDVAILPNPGMMTDLASRGKLVPIDSLLDMERLRRELSSAWLDLGTVEGRLYGLFVKADS